MTEANADDAPRAIGYVDFPSFVAMAFETLNHRRQFDPSWIIDAIVWRLMRLRSDKSRRLIINVPPSSLKSTIVLVAWCSWCLRYEPTKRIAETFNGKVRAECIDQNWFLSVEDARVKSEAYRHEYNSE